MSNRVIKYVHPPIMPQSRPRLHQSALIKVLIDSAGLALQADYWRVCLDDSITIKVLGWRERRSGCSFRLGCAFARTVTVRVFGFSGLMERHSTDEGSSRSVRASDNGQLMGYFFLRLRLMESTIIIWLLTF